MICHCWFFNHGFGFTDSVYIGWYDLTLLSLNISDIAITTVKRVDYSHTIHDIGKSEATLFLENSVLSDRGYI